MKARRIVAPIEAVEWDGSQKSLEVIVKMCSKDYEITVEDGCLSISDHLNGFECHVDIGCFVIIEDRKISVMHRDVFERRYEVVEEEAI